MTKTLFQYPDESSDEGRSIQGFMKFPQFQDQVPDGLIHKSQNAPELDERCRANNKLLHWGLVLLNQQGRAFRELLIEARRNNANNELIAQDLQVLREVVVKQSIDD